jgi:hypothetical protein
MGSKIGDDGNVRMAARSPGGVNPFTHVLPQAPAVGECLR